MRIINEKEKEITIECLKKYYENTNKEIFKIAYSYIEDRSMTKNMKCWLINYFNVDVGIINQCINLEDFYYLVKYAQKCDFTIKNRYYSSFKNEITDDFL